MKLVSFAHTDDAADGPVFFSRTKWCFARKDVLDPMENQSLAKSKHPFERQARLATNRLGNSDLVAREDLVDGVTIVLLLDQRKKVVQTLKRCLCHCRAVCPQSGALGQYPLDI